MASKARWYRVDALRRGGRAGEASALAKEALAELAQVRPWDMLLPEAWWIAHQALSQNIEHDAADAVLAEAQAWIADAMRDAPAAFRDGYAQRNADYYAGRG